MIGGGQQRSEGSRGRESVCLRWDLFMATYHGPDRYQLGGRGTGWKPLGMSIHVAVTIPRTNETDDVYFGIGSLGCYHLARWPTPRSEEDTVEQAQSAADRSQPS